MDSSLENADNDVRSNNKYKIKKKIIDLIHQDKLNQAKWIEIISTNFESYADFVSEVTEHFTCIVCYNVVVDPITLPECLHNICHECILSGLRSEYSKCPVCRLDFNSEGEAFVINKNLNLALNTIFNR